MGLKKVNFSQTRGILNYSIVTKYYRAGTQDKSLARSYPLTECTKEFFKQVPIDNFEEVYSNYSLGALACPPINTTFVVSGIYNSPVFRFIQLTVSPCVNATGNEVVCKDQSEIDEFLHTGIDGGEPHQMQIFYTDNVIDVSNFYNPYESGLLSRRWFIPHQQSNVVDMYITKYNIISTKSWVPYSGNLSEQTFKIERQDVETLFYTNATGPLLQVTLRMNDLVYEYYRSYSTLIDTLSKIGGIFTILSASFGFFAASYNLYKMKVTIANSVYQIYDEGGSPKRKPSEHIEMAIKEGDSKKRNSMGEMDLASASAGPKADPRDILTRLQEVFIKKLAGIKIRSGFRSFLRDMCPCDCLKRNSSDAIIMKQVKQKLCNDIDIIEVVKKVQQFEKFKELMLTKHQKEVFNFTPKPKIYQSMEAHKLKDEIDVTAGFLNYKKNHYQTLSALVRLQAAYAELEKETDPRLARINAEMIKLMGKEMQANLKKLGRVIEKSPELLNDLEKFEREHKVGAEEDDEGSGEEFLWDEDENEPKGLQLNEKKVLSPKSGKANVAYPLQVSLIPNEMTDPNTSRDLITEPSGNGQDKPTGMDDSRIL